MKKILVIVMLALLLVLPIMGIVIAQDAAEDISAGVDAEVTVDWIVSLANFFGWETTWKAVIMSLAVLVIITAGAYDVLAFTAFESSGVKWAIAGGIGLIVAVARGVTILTTLLMSIVGGSIAIGMTIVIIVAVIFFVIGSIAKGKIKGMKAHAQATELKGLVDLAATADAGKIKSAKAMLKAANP